MKTIKHKLEMAIFGYTPGEFLPIRSDGKLVNKHKFIAYKMKNCARHIGAATYGLMSFAICTAKIIAQAD